MKLGELCFFPFMQATNSIFFPALEKQSENLTSEATYNAKCSALGQHFIHGPERFKFNSFSQNRGVDSLTQFNSNVSEVI